MTNLQSNWNLIKDQIRGNGMAWGIVALGWLVLKKIRSKCLCFLLGAQGLNLGFGCHLHGIKFIRFGQDVSARSNLWLEAITSYQGKTFSPTIIIGDRVRFSDAVHITAIYKIDIGHDVLFGSGVFVSDHNHGAYVGDIHSSPEEPPAMRSLYSHGAVVIEDNVWLGDNVNIVGPVRIGFGAVIGANAVVRRDVPPRTIVAGTSARVIKSFDRDAMQWLSP